MSQPAAAPGIVNCPTCHGRVPPLLPFPFPFLPGGPFLRDTPSTPSGGDPVMRIGPQIEETLRAHTRVSSNEAKARRSFNNF